ncbi:hypothetical protein ACR5KS_03630 [Leucobacter sp. W1153]|uniref:hypothetical protein n=1 Tax=Leucobacter sp. W1153 TaxID=3439064 RepID=UPI003F3BD2EE
MSNIKTNFSLEELTLGEISQLEELSGLSLSEIADDHAPKGKFMTALAYLAKRREDPSFTYSQAEMLKLSEVQDILGGDVLGEAVAA